MRNLTREKRNTTLKQIRLLSDITSSYKQLRAQLRAVLLRQCLHDPLRGSRQRPRRTASAPATGTPRRTRSTSCPGRPARPGRRRRRAARAAPARPPRGRRRSDRRRRHASSTTKARSCLTAGNVITSSYWIGSRDAASSASRSSSKYPPRPLEQVGCSSPSQPSPTARGSPGIEERLRVALDPQLGLERAVERPRPPPSPAAKPPSTIAADVRSAPPAARRPRQVDARDLEEVDPLVADRDIPCRRRRAGRAAASVRSTAWSPHRLRQREPVRLRVGGHERRRVDLGEPGADEHVLDETAQALHRRERAEHRPPHRQRERNLVEPEARDLLDQVDLARRRRGSPGRHRHVPVAVDVEAEPLRIARCSSSGSLETDQRVGALGPEADDRPLRQLPLDVASRPASVRRRARRAAASRTIAACAARYGSTPFSQRFEPSVRSLQPLRAAEQRRAARSWPPRAGPPSSSSRTSVSSPPMIPASATERSASAITRSDGSSSRIVAVERAELLARAARAGRRSGRPRACVRSKACSGLPSASIT